MQSLLETTMNTRDLGGYETNLGTYTNCDMFLRSDELLRPSEHDIAYLSDRQITTIIDTRGKLAAEKTPSPFGAMLAFKYYHISIDEGSGIPNSPKAVPASYMEIAGSRNIGKVFHCLALAPHGVLFHCSAGKDRTGVVSAVLLLLAGVSEKDIVENYMMTKEYNQRRFAWARKNLPNIDINIIIPHKEYITGFLSLFKKTYGNGEHYLQSIGISPKETRLLKEKIARQY